MRSALFPILLLAGVSLSASSFPRSVIRVNFTCANSKECGVSGTLLIRANGSSSAAQRIRVEGQSSEIDVAGVNANDLEIDLEAERFWMPRQRIAVVPGKSYDLQAWKTTALRGRFAVQNRTKEMPASFSLKVESPPGTAGATVSGGTTFECKVSPEGAFGCLVPATPLDVVLRAKSFVSEYRWDVKLKPDVPADLGTIVLREGSSVVAWLDSSTAKTLKQPATARLVRMTMAPSPTLGDRLNQPVAEATFNRRGFVQLYPVAAGTYVLEITAAGFAPVRLDRIEVYERSESALRSAIKLEPPFTIRLRLEPAHSPSGSPWRVSLRKENPLTFRASPVADGIAGENGEFEIDGQSSGRFTVAVSDNDGNRFASTEFIVHDESDTEHLIQIESVGIDGKITADGQPIAANLFFGGRNGAERIKAVAGDEGTFHVALPHRGKWIVDVENEQEGILAAVSITIADKEDRLSIELPNTEIGGRVIGPDGERVPGAAVDLQTVAGQVSRRAGLDGTFRFRGVTPGNAMIHAVDTRTSEQSRYVPIAITDGQRRNDIELTTQNTRSLKGTVVSQGQPVVGARVTGYGFGTGMARQERAITGLDGGFELSFPVSAKEIALIVAAAGRTLHTFSTPPTDAKLTLDVATAGGVLRLRRIPGTSRPGVTYNGTPIPFPDLMDWAEAQGAAWQGEFIQIPNVAPGVYGFCVFRDTAKECRAGTLAQGSVLSLGGE